MPLLLTRSDVARLLPLDDCIAAVEEAFRAYGGQLHPPAVLSAHEGIRRVSHQGRVRDARAPDRESSSIPPAPRTRLAIAHDRAIERGIGVEVALARS